MEHISFKDHKNIHLTLHGVMYKLVQLWSSPLVELSVALGFGGMICSWNLYLPKSEYTHEFTCDSRKGNIYVYNNTCSDPAYRERESISYIFVKFDDPWRSIRMKM